jgi:predicted outer membrane protein
VAKSPSERFVDLAGRAGQVTQGDRDFVYRATVQCLYDTELAQMATDRTSNSAVIDFAQGVKNECRALDRQLSRIAIGYVGVRPPVRLDRSHAAMRDQLSAMAAGQAFDKAYVLDQIAASKGAVQLFGQQSYWGGEPVLQRFATASLPELLRRQSAAETLGSQLPD